MPEPCPVPPCIPTSLSKAAHPCTYMHPHLYMPTPLSMAVHPVPQLHMPMQAHTILAPSLITRLALPLVHHQLCTSVHAHTCLCIPVPSSTDACTLFHDCTSPHIPTHAHTPSTHGHALIHSISI